MSTLTTRAVESAYRVLARYSPYDAWARLERRQANQWLPEDALERKRAGKLRALIEHARAHVPFYREHWSPTVSASVGIESFADLARFPVVEKTDLIRAWDRNTLGLEAVGGYEVTHTSGTTGPCLYLPATKADMQSKYASYLRQFYTVGWSLGVRSAALHYSGHPEFGGAYTGKKDSDSFSLTRKIVFGAAHRRRLLPPWQTTEYCGDESFPREWHRLLLVHRPQLLETMDFNLLALYRYLVKHELPPPRIPVIFVLATLAPGLRKRLERFFQATIYNRYGPHEIEGIAYQCEHRDGLHVSADCVHLEVLDDDHKPVSPGTPGHIVVTDLESRTLPLIRYKIGDIGYLLDRVCSCGRSFPLMGDIQGRAGDSFTARAGRHVPAAAVSTALQELEELFLFQVVQDDRGEVRVLLPPGDRPPGADITTNIVCTVKSLLGSDAKVRCLWDEPLRLEFNGKFLFAKRG